MRICVFFATVESGVIREVRLGERLKLVNNKPIGPWFKVYDETTRSKGWIHGNTIEIE